MSVSKQAINEFIRRLAGHRARPGYFNPYTQRHAQENLRQYLLLMAECVAEPVLVVGEAPGYKGCRLTGIPFSSSDFVLDPPHDFWQKLAPRLSITETSKENTASIVWRFLATQQVLPLFWNAFPFHPYRPYRPRTNRSPNRRELVVGQNYLTELAGIFPISTVVGLGKRGYEQVKHCLPEYEVTYVRHPSFGGKNQFISQMAPILSRI